MSKDGCLPPGVEVSDIPGNRPEDIAFEKWIDEELENLVRRWVDENKDFLVEQWIQILLDDPNREFREVKLNPLKGCREIIYTPKFWNWVLNQWNEV